MSKIKIIFHALIFPKTAVIIVCVPVAAALLIFTFVGGHKNTALGYFSYLLSAYALTILCARVSHIFKYISTLAHTNKTSHLYLTDRRFRTQVSLYSSLSINAAYAAIKLFTGIYYGSVWSITTSVYYIILAIMRFLLLRHWHANDADYISELKRYRLCGELLLGMNITISGMATLVVVNNNGFRYPGILIYAMAAYTFYITTTAIINIIKSRKMKSPVISAAKIINLAAALVSMFSLETAMLAQFGEGDEKFQLIITTITGAVVCAAVLGIAVFMIVSSTVKLNKNRH